uniref:Major facilitator superfamily (MFS) profile domain-containing protein n=1 Tax=Globisporangium ultimum (strain ATCC 200006 / CBS 805.95 / DAOM BR144) TaxID=431595 RepID=K3WX84_GLOUD
MATVNRHGYAAGQQITKRLDALGDADHVHSRFAGVPWWFLRVYVVAGGVWGLTTTHTVMFAFVLRRIQDDIPLSTGQKSMLTASLMLGAFIGSFVFGYIADSCGRRHALLIAFVIAHIGGALTMASPSMEVLTTFRFIAGLGLGGVQPVILALIMELAPAKVRGRTLAYLELFWTIGMLVAVLIGRELGPIIGWRATFGFHGFALLYTFFIYNYVPESPKWLATIGRFDEAVRVLRGIESACSVYLEEAADAPIIDPAGQEGDGSRAGAFMIQTTPLSFFKFIANRFRILLRYPYLSRTLVLWVTFLGLALVEHIMDIYLTGLFLRESSVLRDKLIVVYGVIVTQFPGGLIAGFLIDRIGRKYTVIGSLFLMSIGFLLEAYVTPSMFSLFVSGTCRSLGLTSAWGSLYAYTPELYPISVRIMGISYAWGLNYFGAFAGPYSIIWMVDHWHFRLTTVMWMLVSILLVVIVVLFFFGIETAHKDSDKWDYKAPSSMSTLGSTATTTNLAMHGGVDAYTKHADEEKTPVKTFFLV